MNHGYNCTSTIIRKSSSVAQQHHRCPTRPATSCCLFGSIDQQTASGLLLSEQCLVISMPKWRSRSITSGNSFEHERYCHTYLLPPSTITASTVYEENHSSSKGRPTCRRRRRAPYAHIAAVIGYTSILQFYWRHMDSVSIHRSTMCNTSVFQSHHVLWILALLPVRRTRRPSARARRTIWSLAIDR